MELRTSDFNRCILRASVGRYSMKRASRSRSGRRCPGNDPELESAYVPTLVTLPVEHGQDLSAED